MSKAAYLKELDLDNRSMVDKINIALYLSATLADKLNNGVLVVEEEVLDMLWGHIDGISLNSLFRLRDGLCSLAASMAFDIEKEEKRLTEEIKTMVLLGCTHIDFTELFLTEDVS